MSNHLHLQVEKKSRLLIIIFFLCTSISFFAQEECLIIGRTTGELSIKEKLNIRVFGFSSSLSGQVTLPGVSINVIEGDSVNIDFWNISQGNPVSLYCESIEFLQKEENGKVMKEKKPIDHMEHGFYSFKAEKPGVYLYYSPENNPFNFQAGMFGTIIIQPKKNDSLSEKKGNEALWCSHEIDTKWHTDQIMNVAHDDINKPIVLPKYNPDYFLINGKMIKDIKGLQSLNDIKSEGVLLRLVNSGLYLHEIALPSSMKFKLIFGDANHVLVSSKEIKIQLYPKECLELLLFLENIEEKERILYRFIDPILKKVHFKANIPVFY
ncbi:multicopper oxidase domain-containing protein [Flavobacterium sediminilitoris]|uniref:Multicopper oxidase domain-containing protein n=1 Tax=Flavobacterium sediminilitoris TaxID=2024526 RepID=A0ABY4HLZ2_9FLAO|nr:MULTISPECIES: multicopper oxidase domain-containing protein [Flavobacterium]UOX33593.1 multicopper oxidase domain-containing protein [Flavobacterium sediminilitoris]